MTSSCAYGTFHYFTRSPVNNKTLLVQITAWRQSGDKPSTEKNICSLTHKCVTRPHWNKAVSLQWRDDKRDGVSNHQPHDCLLNRLFRPRSNKASKLRVTGLCPGNSPVTGEFPAQMASSAENVSIWWRHHAIWTRCNISNAICVWLWTVSLEAI